MRQCLPREHSRCAPLVPLRCHACRVDVLPAAEERPRARHGQLERMAISSLRNAERVRDQSVSAVESLKRAHAAELRSTSACSAPFSAPPTCTEPSTTRTGRCGRGTPATRRTARARTHARTHAGPRVLDAAWSVSAARCPACGCNGRTQVPPTRACRARCEAERHPRRFG